MAKLVAADIAFARVNDSALLATHPHLRRITVDTPSGPASTPAPASQFVGEKRDYGAVPALGAQSEAKCEPGEGSVSDAGDDPSPASP